MLVAIGHQVPLHVELLDLPVQCDRLVPVLPPAVGLVGFDPAEEDLVVVIGGVKPPDKGPELRPGVDAVAVDKLERQRAIGNDEVHLLSQSPHPPVLLGQDHELVLQVTLFIGQVLGELGHQLHPLPAQLELGEQGGSRGALACPRPAIQVDDDGELDDSRDVQ